MSKTKPDISVIVIGDVHSGKSSLIEHLVYMRGGVDKRTIERCEKEAVAVSCSIQYLTACNISTV
jgi:translation elongation factor EF-1alpha